MIRPLPKPVYLFILTFCLLLGACRSPVETPPKEAITVQLKWIHQAQFAGFYAAQEKGYYAEENLEVKFIPGGVGVDIFEPVIAGEADFGVAGAHNIILKRAAGLPVTAIATTYRINPFVLVAFADSGIRSPRDFEGRTVSLIEGIDQAQFYAMLNNVGVDATQVKMVPYTYDDTPFLEGEVDVTISFAAGSLLPLQDKIGDRAINLIWPDDYGVHFYSDTIMATDDMIANNPDLVLRFLRATLKGHRFAVENPAEAITASMKYAEDQDLTVQTKMLEASLPMIHTGQDQIGWMRGEVWQYMYDTLLEQGILDKPIAIDQVYTMAFLERIYGDE